VPARYAAIIAPAQHTRSCCILVMTRGAADRGMRLAAGDHGDAWRPLQAVCFDIPPDAPQHLVPCRRQRRGIGHRRASHETNAGRRRKAEQVQQPAGRHMFHRRRSGRQHMKTRVLVPGGRQPLGGDGRRHTAARDKAK
jgi:hypothetical protein